jgi:hypothetical protein
VQAAVMHTDPKSSVDILEHVTEGGVHVETFHAPSGERRSFGSVIALVETETYSHSHPADPRSSHGRRGE